MNKNNEYLLFTWQIVILVKYNFMNFLYHLKQGLIFVKLLIMNIYVII